MDNSHRNKYKVGLALSGGITRCFAQIGVLQALEEKELKPEIISAVSAGAIIGALYADGNPPHEILNILTSKRLIDFLGFSLRKKGMFQLTGLKKVIEKNLSTSLIEELKIPMIIFAVNFNKAEYTAFTSGDLVNAVIASSSLPVIFPPVKIGEHYFVDGGVVNNFPVDPLVDKCDILIGVNVNPISETTKIGGAFNIAGRAYRLLVRSHPLGRKLNCDYYIEPAGLKGHGLMEMSKAGELYNIGYMATQKMLEENPPEIKSRLKHEDT